MAKQYSGVGFLLVNLGSPDAPRTPEVRTYLREFLSDPRVIDVHPIARALILNLFILPFRPAKSAEAYRKIWTQQGSPLILNSQKLQSNVAARIADAPVELAMRYGNPSIREGLLALSEVECKRIVVLPLYPQYADSSTETVIQKVLEESRRLPGTPDLVFVPPFYEHPGFIRAFAEVGRAELETFKPDHILMSFHGVPERHVKKGDPSGSHCLATETCCNEVGSINRTCYRAHCFATSRALTRELELDPKDVTVAFQSRLGATPWIRPYTDVVLSELPKKGIRRLAVFSPSFVADCLETLEEIGIRGNETFQEAGGEALHLIPSLNFNPIWVDTVVNLLEEGIGGVSHETGT